MKKNLANEVVINVQRSYHKSNIEDQRKSRTELISTEEKNVIRQACDSKSCVCWACSWRHHPWRVHPYNEEPVLSLVFFFWCTSQDLENKKFIRAWRLEIWDQEVKDDLPRLGIGSWIRNTKSMILKASPSAYQRQLTTSPSIPKGNC